ncbi:MAG TPA: PH domain-containing protein [Lacunisphaera sp.]|nr:PH domain-containing protein [Lacunisphaera sp.]
MHQRFTSTLLRWLRVPPEPQPPHGDATSLRVFRAGKNFLHLKLFGWGLGQVLAFAGIVFWVVMFVAVETEVLARRPTQPAPAPFTVDSFVRSMEAVGRNAVAAHDNKTRSGLMAWFTGLKQTIAQAALSLPPWGFSALWVLKIAGIVIYFLQLPLTYLVARLDYELRWYMVTDRSLRLRHGVWKVSESTMSFANIQQVVVSQGPLQRLLGLSDVKVQSAGGGGGGNDVHSHMHEKDDMHLGLFHSVTNGAEIRDLILDRLRRFRESGLGDPEEKPSAAPAPATPVTTGDLLAAAQEFAAEARALRLTLL